ncbi:hypothetical protein [Streptomyces sp. NPDC055681]
MWDDELVHGAQCRIAHRMDCPDAEPEDPWPWTTIRRRRICRCGSRWG